VFSRSKAWAIGLLIGVFVAGFAAGAAIQDAVGTSRTVAQPPAPAGSAGEEARRPGSREGGRRGGPGGPGLARRSYSAYLAERLQLSEAQRDSVGAILQRHRQQMSAIFRAVRPQVDSLRAVIAAEIMRQLTPEQRVAFQALVDRERAEWARRDSAERHAR
jgi:Spy/CpxP family protein refolding chaperone